MRALTRNRIRRLEYWAVLTLVLFVAVFAAAGIWAGGGETWASLARVDAGLVAAMLALSLVNYGLRTLRWQLFARANGVRVPPARTALYYFAGFALTTTPGKVGEALRLWLLERSDGYRYERTAPLLVVDRVSDLHATLLLSLIGLAGLSGYVGATVLALVLAAAMTLLLARPRLLIAMLNGIYARTRRAPRLFARGRTALKLTSRLFAPRVYLAGLALALAGWFAECLAFWLLLEALGAGVPLLAAVFVFCFAMVLGGVTLLPGGLGGMELASVALLVSLGMAAADAVAATAVIRLTTLWFAVALGFIALPVAMRRAARGRPQPAPRLTS